MTTNQTYRRRLWAGVRSVLYGFDAGASIRHGLKVPAGHPSRRRRLDHEEVERRLADLYPRT